MTVLAVLDTATGTATRFLSASSGLYRTHVAAPLEGVAWTPEALRGFVSQPPEDFRVDRPPQAVTNPGHLDLPPSVA